MQFSHAVYPCSLTSSLSAVCYRLANSLAMQFNHAVQPTDQAVQSGVHPVYRLGSQQLNQLQ
jgi:hypothetical protein